MGKVKGKVIYTTDQSAQIQPQQQQQQQQSVLQQTVTIQQPRVIYQKQLPVAVQQQVPDQNVRIIYTQPSPQMQVQMVPGEHVRAAAYVLQPANSAILQPNTDGALKTERNEEHIPQLSENLRIIYAPQAQLQVQMPHLGINTLQVQDGSIINRPEQVVCEIDLNQAYPQIQKTASLNEEHLRSTVMHTNMAPGAYAELQQQQHMQQLRAEEQHQITETQLAMMHTKKAGHTIQLDITQEKKQQGDLADDIVSKMMKKKEKVLLPCSQCKDMFRTQCQLQAHIRNKHIKPFKCDSCWKAFSFESQLKLHVTTHTGEKPYKCDVCPKAYARKTALFNHVRIHARKKFFKCCKYCGKGFKNEAKLEKHERMHSMGDDSKYNMNVFNNAKQE